MGSPPRIIHVGAHVAEELDSYESAGWGSEATVWVEALPEQAAIVRDKVTGRPSHRVIEAVAWEKSGEIITFSVSDNVESSSVLEFADHLTVHPHVKVIGQIQLVTTALADLDIWTGLQDTFLNLDIQGAELSALRGLGHRIDECVAIYCEVNTRELYRGVPLIGDIDAYLLERGFWRADSQIFKKYGWGDALYLRAGSQYRSRFLRRLGRKASQWTFRSSLRSLLGAIRRGAMVLLVGSKTIRPKTLGGEGTR